MNSKKISLSLLLAIALGMSACGGGGNTTPQVGGSGDQTTGDTTAPAFAASIASAYTMEEQSFLDVATIEVSDESLVVFSLEGEDKDYFELTDTKVRSVFETTLKFKSMPDYETKSAYHVTVVATDSKGNRSEKALTVNLEDQPFVFDTTGNMGSVVEGQTATLELVTKEAKTGNITYTITGNDNFVIVGDSVQFTAPDFNSTEGANNTYTALVTANDGNSDITLAVRASVILDGSKPVLKTYLLKSRRDIDGIIETNYRYTYDDDHYLTGVVKTGTNIYGVQGTVFEYSDDHKIMRGYSYGKLKSIRVFEDKNTDKNKFAASIEVRLSADDYVNYLSYTKDTAAMQNNRHLTKYIYGLDKYQTKAELYVYNNDDSLSRILTGVYTIDSDAIAALSDIQLHTLNAPAGGFPTGDTKLTTTQIKSINSGVMPFEVSHETTYAYSGNTLTTRKFFGYATNETMSDNIMVLYYATGVMKEIKSSGIDIKYNTDSLLSEVNGYNYNYNYSTEGNVTVTVRNNGQTVTTYIFEEE